MLLLRKIISSLSGIHKKEMYFAALFSVAVLCTSCGFQPVYAKRGGAEYSSLSNIAVNNGTNTNYGVILKSSIEDLFYRDTKGAYSSPKKYDMNISLIINKKAIIVNADGGEILRYRTTVTSPYVIKEKGSEEEMHKGSIRRIISYNTSDANYAEYVVSEDVIKKAIAEIAEEYALRVGILFADM